MKRTALLMAVGVTVLLALVVGAALATPPKDATTGSPSGAIHPSQ